MKVLAKATNVADGRIKMKAAETLLGSGFSMSAVGTWRTRNGDPVFLFGPTEVYDIKKVYILADVDGKKEWIKPDTGYQSDVEAPVIFFII